MRPFPSDVAPLEALPRRPQRTPARIPAALADADRRARAAGVPVLVVDDDAPSAKLMSIVLRSEGFDVRVAPSAEDALAMFDEFVPRVVVLDLILPLMSGLVLAERLRRSVLTRDALIVAVTVFNGPEAERIALAAGCDLYVRKPIDPNTFCDLVLAHLGGSR